MQPLAWASLVSGAGGLVARPFTTVVGMKITHHVRRRHSSCCAHFILESAHLTSSSHLLVFYFLFAFLSRRVSLFLSAGFSLCKSLCWLLSLLLSLPALSAFLSDPLSRSLFVVLRRSITFYSTLAQSTGLNLERVSACLHLGRPPRLSTLPQLALPASIATCNNRQQNNTCL